MGMEWGATAVFNGNKLYNGLINRHTYFASVPFAF